MVHPVQSVIESLYAAGRCPRLHVNATHASVVCPEEIRHQWKERLIIDLDSSYPLDLTFGQTGLAANLSFGGLVTRCSFPWEAIYVVMDRATGRGIVLDRHVPESVRRQSGAPAAAARLDSNGEPIPERPELRAVSMEPDPIEVSETPASAAASEAAASEAAATSAASATSATSTASAASAASATSAASAASADAPAEPEKPATPATDETQVKKRRAAFRVIDGGG